MAGGLAYVHFGEPPTFVTSTSQDGVHSTTVNSQFVVHWPGIRHQTPLALKFLLAMVAMHLLGLWDDRRALGPYLKLVIQLAIIAGLVMWADLRALTVLDNLGAGKWPSVIVTVLWIVGITNAFNFLDNMDGLSAGVAGVWGGAFLL